MSDEEHHFESKADAGASKTYPQQAGIKGRPCKQFLCDEIVERILTRLPAKSVGRFRCVSKQWLCLSSNRRFVTAHHSHSIISGFFMVENSTMGIRRPTYYFSLDASEQSMISDPLLSFLELEESQVLFDCSCNGLILCHRFLSCLEYTVGYPLYVCNPMTQEYVVVYDDQEIMPEYFSLAFHPILCPQFKIVTIITDYMEYMTMRIFSSETWSWKVLVENLDREFSHIQFISQKSTFWNGALVWLGFNDMLLSLDIKSEQFARIPSWKKSGFSAMYSDNCLFESKGHLYFVGVDKLVLDVLNMEYDDNFSWSLLYRIDLVVIRDLYPEVEVEDKSGLKLSFAPEVEVEDKSGLKLSLAPVYFLRGIGRSDQLLFSVPKKIISYNIQDGKCTTICDNVPRAWNPCKVDRHEWGEFYPVAYNLCSLELFSAAWTTIHTTSKRFQFHAAVSTLLKNLCNKKRILLRELISEGPTTIDKDKLLALIDAEILEATSDRKRENLKLVKYFKNINYPVFVWPS